jgi:predicted TIM-barrel fold metal-dependent hydrolase
MMDVGGQPTVVVDCDIHENFTSIDVLEPRLDDRWRRYYRECRFGGLPRDPYVATAHGGTRVDAWPEHGGPPGSDYELVREQLLDAYGIDYAILTGSFFRVSAMPQAEFATVLTSAYNDWMIEAWLERDRRLLGSLQVALQDPQAAAREIDRLGGHPQVVQVLFPQAAERAFGHPWFDPVYAAAVRNGLRIALHPSGSTGTYPDPTPTGSWPRTYMEYHAAFALPYQAQLASLVCEGTFVRFPDLRVVMLEAGFAWVPHVLWSLDTHWRSLQMEVPWLTRRPSAYVRDHVTFGTQPIIVPDDEAQFVQIMEMMDGEHTLLYASDYPHWDFDDPNRFLPRAVGVEARRRILGANALELYGLPVPEPVT